MWEFQTHSYCVSGGDHYRANCKWNRMKILRIMSGALRMADPRPWTDPIRRRKDGSVGSIVTDKGELQEMNELQKK